jgi:hypothetical protein
MWTSRAGSFALVVPLGIDALKVEKSGDCAETIPEDGKVGGH